MTNTTTLQQSYLIQRLQKPINYEIQFAFGGGYKNGGLSDDAFKLLKGIFSFDYMGAAEYEFGAIPAYFKQMVAARERYVTWEIVINKTPVYVIGNLKDKANISDRIKDISKQKAGYIKCGCNLDQAVGLNIYTKQENCRTIGGLEIDNCFAFFTDKTVFESFCNLFEFPLK